MTTQARCHYCPHPALDDILICGNCADVEAACNICEDECGGSIFRGRVWGLLDEWGSESPVEFFVLRQRSGSDERLPDRAEATALLESRARTAAAPHMLAAFTATGMLTDLRDEEGVVLYARLADGSDKKMITFHFSGVFPSLDPAFTAVCSMVAAGRRPIRGFIVRSLTTNKPLLVVEPPYLFAGGELDIREDDLSDQDSVQEHEAGRQ
jgi:hypothetical protein